MITKCHFIGIGGIGMSGLAKLLINQNVQVSGSDIASSANTLALTQAGAKIFIGHSAGNIQPGVPVVYSSDISANNPELETAKNLQCPLWHRSDLLNEIMQTYKPLVICGTHGKTTTTSLLTATLMEADYQPAFAVGGIVNQLGSNAGDGKGEYFVAEGDESDGTFLKYSPYGAIVTNIDLDHMNYYKTEKNLIEAFQEFINKVASKSHLFWCKDDARLNKLSPPGVSYGFSSDSDLRIENFKQTGWNQTYDIDFEGKHYKEILVNLTGKHNALNSAAVFGLALKLGAQEVDIRIALKQFGGVKRRCEKKGESHGIEIYDDYAHHPTEIETTLKAIRDAVKERRLIAIFQPHRYTRMEHCLGSFGTCLKDADVVIVTDLYTAGENPIPGVTTEAIVKEIQDNHKTKVAYIPRDQLLNYLIKHCVPHDVVVTLGAGDITKLGSELALHWKMHPPRKLVIGMIIGGQTVEHEVCLTSARYFNDCLSSDLYDVRFFSISKQGKWASGEDATQVIKQKLKSVPEPSSHEKIPGDVIVELQKCDIILPVLHGTYGEDGTIQGLFEMLGIAYMGCGHEASAISMNKAVTKKLLLLANVPTLPFVDFSNADWEQNKQNILEEIRKNLKYPLFVKPVHLGSSIGVKKTNDESELLNAIEKGFDYDTHIMIENGVTAREIEFSAIGNDFIKVFPPGEVLTDGEVYDYEAKYSAKAKPCDDVAKLTPEQVLEGIDIATAAFKAVGGQGMARIDTFLDQNGKFWLNEINPIPGCTPNSLYPRMCHANGINGPSLINQLIILGLQRRRRRDHLKV